MSIFKAGDRVRVVNYPEHVRNGYEAKIHAVPTVGTSYLIMFDDERAIGIESRYLELVTAAPQNDDYADMSAEEQVAVLTEELFDMSRNCQMDKKYLKNLQHDLEHYDEVMRETKEEQGWCDDGTNKVIQALNDGFLCHFIEPYAQEHEVEYEIRAEVIVRGTVMVMASSQDAAEEFFKDDIDSYIEQNQLAKDEVNNLGWDTIDTDVV